MPRNNSTALRYCLLQVVRLLHLLSAAFSVTVLAFDYIFDFASFGVVQESQIFRRTQQASGLCLIFSGIALSGLMRKKHALPSQNLWLSLLSRKFIVSLLLTPFVDKLIALLVGSLSEQWREVVKLLKMSAVIGLFGFSAYVKEFRESSDNFSDGKGLSRMLD